MELDLAKEQLPSTQSKVNEHTPDHINQQIERETEASVNYYKRQGEQEIRERINQLDNEWDTERLLKVNLASLTAVSALLAVRSNRKWAILAGASSAAIIQHALQGWTPAIVIFRKMGIRTTDEINREKKALQNLLNKPE